jgi:hypothetical protein
MIRILLHIPMVSIVVKPINTWPKPFHSIDINAYHGKLQRIFILIFGYFTKFTRFEDQQFSNWDRKFLKYFPYQSGIEWPCHQTYNHVSIYTQHDRDIFFGRAGVLWCKFVSATARSQRIWPVQTVAGQLAPRGSDPMSQVEGWSASLRRNYRECPIPPPRALRPVAWLEKSWKARKRSQTTHLRVRCATCHVYAATNGAYRAAILAFLFL